MKKKFYKIIFLLCLSILNNNASNVFMNCINRIHKETVISHFKKHGALEAACILPILMNLRQLNQNKSKESSGEESKKTPLIRLIQYTPLGIFARKEPSSLIETLLEASCFYGLLYAVCKYTGITKKFEGMTTQISKSFHHPTEIILATFSIIHALAKSCSNKNTTIAIEKDSGSGSKRGLKEESAAPRKLPEDQSVHTNKKEPAELGEVVGSQSDPKNKGEGKKPANEIFTPVKTLFIELNLHNSEQQSSPESSLPKELPVAINYQSPYDSNILPKDIPEEPKKSKQILARKNYKPQCESDILRDNILTNKLRIKHYGNKFKDRNYQKRSEERKILEEKLKEEKKNNPNNKKSSQSSKKYISLINFNGTKDQFYYIDKHYKE